VGVVDDAGQGRIVVGDEGTAGPLEALDGEHRETGPAEVGLEDQPVVAGSQDDAVVLIGDVVYLQSKNSFVK
jgi:hypothetical protein